MVIKDKTVELQLPCHPRPVTASHLISSPNHLPKAQRPASSGEKSIARCIAVLAGLPPSLRKPKPTEGTEGADEAQSAEEADDPAGEDDTAIIIFPPTGEGSSVVRALFMGEGTGSCPAGQCKCYDYT